MRVVILAGDHDPRWMTYIAVDNHGTLVDLSNVKGPLADASIQRTEWRPGVDNVEYGSIYYRDGHVQTFHDRSVVDPYIAAFRARVAELQAQSAT